MEKVLGYGVIGTGVYCDHYFGTLGPVFKNLRPVGCSDLNVEAAKAAAARWNVPKVYTTEEMLADPEVEMPDRARPRGRRGHQPGEGRLHGGRDAGHVRQRQRRQERKPRCLRLGGVRGLT